MSMVDPRSQDDVVRRHQLLQAKRVALEQVQTKPGYYISSDSYFGNLILPVVPRFSASAVNSLTNTQTTSTTANSVVNPLNANTAMSNASSINTSNNNPSSLLNNPLTFTPDTNNTTQSNLQSNNNKTDLDYQQQNESTKNEWGEGESDIL